MNFSPSGFWLEFECIPGTYAPTTTMGECLSCPAGYSCPYPATFAPTKCDQNTVSEEGATFCDVCKRGHLCANGLDNGWDYFLIINSQIKQNLGVLRFYWHDEFWENITSRALI